MNKRLLLTLTTVVMLFVGVTALYAQDEPAQDELIEEPVILPGPECDTYCFMGLVPGESTAAEVQTWLNSLPADDLLLMDESVLEGDLLRNGSVIGFTVAAADEDHITYINFFPEDVIDVLIFDRDICGADIITAYGEPQGVYAHTQTGTHIYLYDGDEVMLLFYAKAATPNTIYHTALHASETFAEKDNVTLLDYAPVRAGVAITSMSQPCQ